MKTTQAAPRDINDYIAGFPKEVQDILQKIRATIKQAAPEAEETIRYKIPTFNWNGHYLIYFAAFKRHISLYPAPIGNEDFKEDITPYASGKGTLQFPLDKPIPYKLITKIVKFRLKENAARAKAKTRKNQSSLRD